MPLVFIHGVNNRMSPEYKKAVVRRSAMFKQIFLPAAGLTDTSVRNPYWGGDGATFAFGLASVPTGQESAVQLGPAGEASFATLAAAAAAAAPDTPSENAILLTIAQRDFPAALDLVYLAAVHTDDAEETQLVTLAAHFAEYALSHEQVAPAWLAEVDDDSRFLSRLRENLEGMGPSPTAPESGSVTAPGVTLGWGSDVWERMQEGADRLAQEVGAFLGKPAWSAVRKLMVPTVPLFLGDVFVYLEGRGDATAPGPITAKVIAALRAGEKERSTDEPLIVVGHSLGGIIAYDVLSHFCADLQVDVLCTVGSQVGLFEEMKVLATSDASVTAAAGRKAAKPSGVRQWINVFDYNDVLSYKLEPIFTGVADFDYPTGEVLHAHGAYFGQPSFYRRLGARAGRTLAP